MILLIIALLSAILSWACKVKHPALKERLADIPITSPAHQQLHSPLKGVPRTEYMMAKGQMRSNRETRKPKQEKPKAGAAELAPGKFPSLGKDTAKLKR